MSLRWVKMVFSPLIFVMIYLNSIHTYRLYIVTFFFFSLQSELEICFGEIRSLSCLVSLQTNIYHSFLKVIAEAERSTTSITSRETTSWSWGVEPCTVSRPRSTNQLRNHQRLQVRYDKLQENFVEQISSLL